jgi:NADPH-dependent 2,4-dienoyl-CoA reductase/sulfur reductase-like enzyme
MGLFRLILLFDKSSFPRVVAQGNSDMSYVIIGAGPAGVTAAETLRKQSPDAKIMLVCDHPGLPYSRMAIPYLLTEKVDEQGITLRPDESHFDQLNITLLHDSAAALDLGSKTVLLNRGEPIHYQKLLIASGAKPRQLPTPGNSLPQVQNCWTLEDARLLIAHLKGGSQVVLIGAGFIGTIVLEALIEKGAKVTVIEQGERIVPRMVGPEPSALIRNWCEQKGVVFHTSSVVEEITEVEEGGSLLVHLREGEVIPAERVVVAAGVEPNCSFVEGSAIQMEGGIVVDSHLRSSDPNIYAAGDVAVALDSFSQQLVSHAIQPLAVEQGRIAALNMSGKKVEYSSHFAMNILDTFGLITASFGAWEGVEGGDSVEIMDSTHHRYLCYQFDRDRLVGATTVGRSHDLGIIKGLIRSKASLGRLKEKLKEQPDRLKEIYLEWSKPGFRI